jgi:hypothetical protein
VIQLLCGADREFGTPLPAVRGPQRLSQSSSYDEGPSRGSRRSRLARTKRDSTFAVKRACSGVAVTGRRVGVHAPAAAGCTRMDTCSWSV